MNKRLLNPFTYIAGAQALMLGWVAMLLSAILALYSHAHFDGAIDMHFWPGGAKALFFLEPLVNWGCVTVVFYGCGRLIATTRPRFIDIAGTMALSRAPLLIAALAGFLMPPNVTPEHLPPLFWVSTVFSLFAVIWMIIWMYQAFAVSANLKGTKAAVGFTVSLILAEILSKIVLHYIYAAF